MNKSKPLPTSKAKLVKIGLIPQLSHTKTKLSAQPIPSHSQRRFTTNNNQKISNQQKLQPFHPQQRPFATVAPKRNQPKKSKSNNTNNTNTNNQSSTYPSTKPHQDFVSVFQDELDQLNAAPHPMVSTTNSTTSTNNPTDPTNLSMEDLSQIYGTKAKLILPEIPLTGAQAYWALESDPNNPFVFPILNLTTLLAPTDISVSIDPKDSDVPAEKIFEDYQTMMSTTIQRGQNNNNPQHSANSQNPQYNLNPDYTQDDLEKSLHNISNPHLTNPLQQIAMSQPQKDHPDDYHAQMATSRVQFGQTILITTPVRKSQVNGIKSVFKISDPSATSSSTITPTDTNPYNSNPLNNMICLSKASQSNKRFDVFLSSSVKNAPIKTPMDFNLDSSLQSLQLSNNNNNNDDDLTNKTALLFTSNISHQSLSKTRTRLNQQTQEIKDKLSKQNKTYDAPFQEHVCLERNYLVELERDPVLIPFPFSSHDVNKQDPVTHLLTFPIQASTITYVVDDPLEEPSNELNFRLAEVEFLIQCCLMGQNFPSPIDPKFSILIEQDRNNELTPEESQKVRETIGRSIVAQYGHGSGLAAEKWSLKRPMIKEQLYQQPIPISSPTNNNDNNNNTKSKLQINYELELSYGHNNFYRTLYSLSQLPTEAQIHQQLQSLRQQVLSMSGYDSSMLDKISKENDDVFADLLNPQQEALLSLSSSNHSDLSALSPEEIEIELANRIKQIEQRQYMFQTKFEEQLRMENIQRQRIQNSKNNINQEPLSEMDDTIIDADLVDGDGSADNNNINNNNNHNPSIKITSITKTH